MAGTAAGGLTATKLIVGGVLVAIAVGTGVAVAQTAGGDQRDDATVVRVIDGDTIDATVNGQTERIRLLNVDTPETKHPQEPVQCLGPEATDFLTHLLAPGDRIELEYDVERTDPYGRTLAGVFKDDALVNARIAAAGLGVAVLYEPNDRFYREVLDAQEGATAAGEGLHDPEIGCTLPGLAENALAPLEELPAAIPAELPADVAGVAAALAAVAPVVAAGQALDGALDLVQSGEHVVLSNAYRSTAEGLQPRVDAALPAAKAYQQQLTAQHQSIERQAEEAREMEEARKAEEAREAEQARKAEEAREAEQAREAEEARQAEQAREAEEAREAEQAREVEQARQAEAARTAEVERDRRQQPKQSPQNHQGQQGQQEQRQLQQPQQQRPTPRQPTAPRQQAPGSGYGTDADFPGYTGPRCYAPGGQVWRPCG